MCRYAMYGPYKSHFACFDCRKIFRRSYEARDHQEVRNGMTWQEARALPVPCPQCGQPMRNMGLDFKAPRQGDVEQWEKIRLLFAHGFRWSICGCTGPGFTVATLKDVQPFLSEAARLREEQQRARQSQSKWEAQRKRARARRQELTEKLLSKQAF